MAFSVIIKDWLLAFTLICIFVFGSELGKAQPYLPQIGAAGVPDEETPQKGGEGVDPPEIFAKALQCFNDKYIYSSCEESYRLTESGNLNVEPEHVDEFCEGACVSETHLVLSCIENILSHFVFFNHATVVDVKETIKTGCGYGPKRGDFNVAEHIKAEEDSARKTFNSLLFELVLMIMGYLLML